MTTTLRIIVADDDSLIRQTICSLIAEEQGMDVIAEAADGQEAEELSKSLAPDLIIMDVTMPRKSGIEATQLIKSHLPDVKILAISVSSGRHYVKAMIEAGASGYVLKDEASAELIPAIKAAASGDMYIGHFFYSQLHP